MTVKGLIFFWRWHPVSCIHVRCSEMEKVTGRNTNGLCFTLRSSLIGPLSTFLIGPLSTFLIGPLSTFQAFSTFTCCHNTRFDNTQGDGRKFLDSFRSYFGSQISSRLLNGVHIYRLQPNSATKGDFFPIYFCLWLFPVGVKDCKWRTKSTKCC